MDKQDGYIKQVVSNERSEILSRLEQWLETPMIVLGFIWLALLIVELRWGLNPFLEILGTLIWAVFILDFMVRLVIAPHKFSYLRSNWLTVIALIVPAFRIFRIVRVVRVLRVARAVRGLRLLRVVTSLNRGMKAISASFGRRGFGYVTAALASYFIGRDADNDEAELVGAKPLKELRGEIAALHEELRALRQEIAIQE